jgi:cytochrome P450
LQARLPSPDHNFIKRIKLTTGKGPDEGTKFPYTFDLMKLIPRRLLIPLITDLLEYKQAAKNTIHYTRKMKEKYGDVCEVSFTGVKNYFIHDPEVIKEILTTQGNKMKRTYLFGAFRKFLGNGLFTSDGEHHKQQRKLIKPAFYPERIKEYASIMVNCAKAETDTWKDGDRINIGEAMIRITLNVITRCMFGSGMTNDEVAEAGKHFQVAFDVMNRIVANPFTAYCLIHNIKIPLVRKFYSEKKILDGIVNTIISSYRKQDNSQKKDLLSMLMDARDEETGTGMTDEQIRDEVMTFFLAGHETTTLALTWTLYLLAKNPDAEKKFHEELTSVLHNSLPEVNDYENLHYTKNIFKESLRLYPPAWTFARETREDVTINDYFFPKGAVLWTITYLVHHDEKYFANPEQFHPERWDGEAIKSIPKYSYLPFGGGQRMCIGEGFAWMEGILALATIGSKFKLRLDENFSTDVNPVFSLKPKDKIYMFLSSHVTTGNG